MNTKIINNALPGDFTDEVSDELVVGGLLALAVARLGLEGVGRSLVALLQAGTDLVPGCHDSRLLASRKIKD